MRQPIKFYVDEHVATAVVKGLRQRGADVLTVLEAGLRSASDEEHLAPPQASNLNPPTFLASNLQRFFPRP